MEKAMANVGAALTSKIEPLYKKIMDKIKAMKANLKTDSEILTEGFKIAYAGFTKTLVQSVINTCMMKSTQAEYQCALPPLNVYMRTSLYNMTYNAALG
ncbi:hypothetical protein PENTCL1PPCAC_1050 [Pristionchus entomophagus]|uniref:Uncharacterized protein n=1 Tax=Pristionchus entomophagus TaxID=358040 RepID=A0AAV5S8J4_9BILA|nr:hypothetical protein PENTCL1PPCAC_1050 [Pristionchus entomophagus]